MKMIKDRKLWQPQGTKRRMQGEIGTAVLTCMHRQPLDLNHPMVSNVVVIRRRRREECGRILGRPFAASSNRNNGARSKTNKYGKSCTPHG